MRYNSRRQLIERAGVQYRYDVNGQLAAVIMPTDGRGRADLPATTHYYHNDFAELALELSPEDKDALSHRGRALAQFASWLKEQ